MANFKQEIPFNILGLKERFSDKYILMVRSHVGKQQWVDKNGNSVELKCDDFLMDVGFYDNISELYLVSDILITDYSSSIFDFSILERPQILYAYDLDVYSREVGFVFDYKNFSPFPIVKTEDDLYGAILCADQQNKIELKKFKEKGV